MIVVRLIAFHLAHTKKPFAQNSPSRRLSPPVSLGATFISPRNAVMVVDDDIMRVARSLLSRGANK